MRVSLSPAAAAACLAAALAAVVPAQPWARSIGPGGAFVASHALPSETG